jgi:flagellar basal body-associated protein FliL
MHIRKQTKKVIIIIIIIVTIIIIITIAIPITQIYNNSNSNNSIQFFIIYVPSQRPQGQLQAQHSVDTDNYIMDKHNIKSKTS